MKAKKPLSAAQILDGKKIASQIKKDLKRRIETLPVKPKLAIILVGDDAASKVYVREKEKVAAEIGAGFCLIKRRETTSQVELEKIINELNADKSVTGILVQKPLPKQVDDEEIDLLIAPHKDVDGLNPISPFTPATTKGILDLLSRYKIAVAGSKVVVVGRGKLVGLPTALEFLSRGATVTICHSKTKNLARETRSAEILIVAAGKPNLITGSMVGKGAIVIDVGINRLAIRNKRQAKVVGDVDFESAAKVARYITPVPGGVGPMTVAALMQNLVEATSKYS